MTLEKAPPRTRTRERIGYFDLLRAAALLRVITYHTVGWAWLHMYVPAIGVMFALAGSLMADSLGRRPALQVVTSRIRRILPPVWAFGIVAVAIGWVTVGSGWHEWIHLLYWVVPIRDPESRSTGFGFVDILWYVRTYIWFVIFSPALLRAVRRSPIVTLIAPLALLPVAVLTSFVKWPGQGVVLDLLGYGTCWVLGLAARDGLLDELPLPVYGVVVAGLSAAGLAIEVIFPFGPSPETRPVFIGYALWSAAFVMIVMRFRPDTGWLRRIGWLDRAVAIINARAVTIYIWHDAAIGVSAVFLHAMHVHVAHLIELPAVLVFTGIAMLAFGWVEDLAARRKPALLPTAL